MITCVVSIYMVNFVPARDFFVPVVFPNSLGFIVIRGSVNPPVSIIQSELLLRIAFVLDYLRYLASVVLLQISLPRILQIVGLLLVFQ